MPKIMDKIDRHILEVLQVNARISNAELAEQVNLSPTPCLRRMKRLEQQGIISKYVAELNREQIGLSISAFVFIQLERNSLKNADAFEARLETLEEVMDCFVLTGEHDYLLSVVSESLVTYEKFVKEKLAAIPQVSKIDTTVVLNQVMSRKSLPIPR